MMDSLPLHQKPATNGTAIPTRLDLNICLFDFAFFFFSVLSLFGHTYITSYPQFNTKICPIYKQFINSVLVKYLSF